MTGEMSSRDDDHDYRAMEAALSETERGRWFLFEHTRRHRGQDTQILLDAIGRIEAVVARRGSRQPASPASAPDGSAELLSEVERLVAGAGPGLSDLANDASEPWSRQIEAANSDVLDATERIQEAAWNLRERGADPALCDLLDQRATEIYAACAVQERLTALSGVAIEALRAIRERLAGERPSTGRDLAAAGPQALRADLASPIDHGADPALAPVASTDPAPLLGVATIAGLGGPPTSIEPERHEPEGPAGGADTYPTTLAAIDALDAREKLRLFT